MSGVRDVTDDFVVEEAAPASRPQGEPQRETDRHRLVQRQKQIDLGKNTLGYQRYREAVQREKRNRKKDPITPDVYQVCSKRAFEGQVKKWRRMLHTWDPPGQEEGGGPALLPVVSDLGPAANPPPPAADQPDSFEHISHADAASPKKGDAAAARLAGSQLPLKLPSAVRRGKRSFDEALAAGNENQPPQQGQQQAQQHCLHLGAQSAQPSRGPAPGAKHQRRSAELPPAPATGGKATPAGAPVAPPKELSWSEQRYGQPQLDYGASDEDEDWQLVGGDEAGAGRYQHMVYNNPAADEAWDEEDIQV